MLCNQDLVIHNICSIWSGVGSQSQVDDKGLCDLRHSKIPNKKDRMGGDLAPANLAIFSLFCKDR